ncbi:MAG TPA: EAL domain-containing protein [Acidimicrobiales bacterium]|nr:EAL domain-containing protein [Acidimicrobiales bacterium]
MVQAQDRTAPRAGVGTSFDQGAYVRGLDGDTPQVAFVHAGAASPFGRPLLDRLPAAVVVTGDRGLVVYWNAEATRLFGYAAEQAMGRSLEHAGIWPPCTPPKQGNDVGGVPRWEGEHGSRRADGTNVRVRTTLERVDDDALGLHGIVGVSVDLSGRHELDADLVHRAFHDALTGLPTRALLLEHLQRALARDARSARETAALVVDLDDFASVNDRCGRPHGDAVLRAVAQRLSGVVRGGDMVARLGADEFAICCEGLADRSEAGAVAQRIVDALGLPLTSGVESLARVSVSVGVATAGPDSDPTTLLHHAHQALVGAKARGKARVELFEDEPAPRSRTGYEMAAELEGAVAHGEIEVVYQPEYELSSGELFGFEALARWTHPKWGPVAPSDFIRAAELSGTIGELGAQVLETACGVLTRWSTDRERPVRMTVNVSALQLADPMFPGIVQRALATSGAPPGWVCLEITESALASGEVAVRALDQLKALGVETSVDDFGTEYSSLSRLQLFPIDYLKIDRGFVSGMIERPVDAAIIEALLGLARSLGIRTIAKGVEDVAQLAALEAAGCELGQGFLWSKPLPAAQASRLVELSRARAS